MFSQLNTVEHINITLYPVYEGCQREGILDFEIGVEHNLVGEAGEGPDHTKNQVAHLEGT